MKYNELETINFKLGTNEINLVKVAELKYQIEFVQSLSNIRTINDLLIITMDSDGLTKSTYTLEQDVVKLDYQISKNQRLFKQAMQNDRHQKLHIFKNFNVLEKLFKQGFTLILDPNNIVVDDNNMPSLIYRGFQQLLEPIEQTEAELVHQFKCLIVSEFQTKYDFEALYNGALEIIKKTPFFEKIVEAKTIQEIIEIMDLTYAQDKEDFEKKMTTVTKRKYNTFRTTTVIATIAALVTIFPLVYNVFVVNATQSQMQAVTEKFVANKHQEVIEELKNEVPSKLPNAQRYMLANSYLNLEQTLGSQENKNAALQNLKANSDVRIFDFWIYLGREDFKTASEIAKDLNFDTLRYIAAYKAIPILEKQAGSGEAKQEQIQKYTKELEEMKAKLNPTTTETSSDKSKKGE